VSGPKARLRPDEGVSLVEMLIAMLIALVVGGVAMQSVVANLQSQRRLTDQTRVLTDAKVALERMTRDLRGANPLDAAGPAAATMSIVRAGQRRTVSYWLCPTGVVCALSAATPAGTQLIADERTRNVTTGAVVADPPAQVLLTGVAMPAGVGTFRYSQADGTALTGTLTPAQLANVRLVTARVRMPIGPATNAVDLENQIMLRNAGG